MTRAIRHFFGAPAILVCEPTSDFRPGECDRLDHQTTRSRSPARNLRLFGHIGSFAMALAGLRRSRICGTEAAWRWFHRRSGAGDSRLVYPVIWAWLDAGLHFAASSGYTGQTLETIQLPDQAAPTERVVGVRQTSYAGVTLTDRVHEHSE